MHHILSLFPCWMFCSFSCLTIYPEGHHLLMYDVQKEKVIADIGTWLSDLPERLAQKKSKDTRSANRR